MPLEHIRISEQGKDQLIKLKRLTGIQNWNVLCRWAFCLSLAETTPPVHVRIPGDSSVEMTWRVFGGHYQEIYLALLKQRCRDDGLDISDEVLTTQFRLHLHRGIAHLSADRRLRNIAELVARTRPKHSLQSQE
jgi:DNA sulfur modification protein DndE